MNPFIPIFGQLCIILALVWTMAIANTEVNKMNYSFYVIFVNRIRYINHIGFFFWLRGQIPHYRSTLPYHKFNTPYTWLKQNILYTGYGLYILATTFLVYEMIIQIGNGEVYTKPADFFFLSPLRSFAIGSIIYYLVKERDEWMRKFYSMFRINQKLSSENEDLKKKNEELQKTITE